MSIRDVYLCWSLLIKTLHILVVETSFYRIMNFGYPAVLLFLAILIFLTGQILLEHFMHMHIMTV